MTVNIINADVIEGLRSLPDESVQCVVTSPPYWGLRDYGVAGQIGLEPTFPEFIKRLVAVFAEVRRVLRPDGVCFVNMGDSYATGTNANRPATTTEGPAVPSGWSNRSQGVRRHADGLKPKDLIGQPWRLAFALQDSGWWLRGDYIWAKPNPMPESVTDRCTKAHEYVFHLTKSERYYWDQEAIADSAIHAGKVVSLGEKSLSKGQANGAGVAASGNGAADSVTVKDTRNKRSVWTIATSPFPEAHFATFPPDLPEICIKAGSKPGDTILDPFSGAGTTALVADRLQRHAIGIELNPEYVAISERRIAGDRGGLLDIMEAAE